MGGKRGQMWETMIPWIIAIGILVLISIFAYILKDELMEVAVRFKNIFR